MSPRERATIERWRSRIERADRHIEAKEYRKAEKLAEGLIEDFTAQLLGGPQAKDYYGLVLMRRALARFGAGDLREAQYDWDIARSFLPELEEHLTPPTGDPVVARDTSGTVSPPRVLEKKKPTYAAAARIGGIEGTIVVEGVIDREGRVTRPRVLKSLDPGLDFQTLEALREWRFEPARLEGQGAHPAYYVFTIRFDLRDPYRGPTPYVVPNFPLVPYRSAPQVDRNNEGAPPPGGG